MSQSNPRVIAVLGYSEGRAGELHPVCAARLEHAARISTTCDIVVLTGWSRGGSGHTEAALMARAWAGQAAEVVVDENARTTVENAAHTVAIARRAGASEVVVVTSAWHSARAGAAFRWLLRGRGVRVRRSSPAGPPSLKLRVRELALWALLPGQLARVRER